MARETWLGERRDAVRPTMRRAAMTTLTIPPTCSTSGSGSSDHPARCDGARRAVRHRQVFRADHRGWHAGRRRRPVRRDAGPGQSAIWASRWSGAACRICPATAEFDAAVTIDALENVPPEDWPAVLANLRRAVRPGGVLYMTVEEVDQKHIDAAFESLTSARLPAVHGEIVEGNVAGYHYYPGRERVLGWLAAAGLEIIDDGVTAPGKPGGTGTSCCARLSKADPVPPARLPGRGRSAATGRARSGRTPGEPRRTGSPAAGRCSWPRPARTPERVHAPPPRCTSGCRSGRRSRR